jgi:hypothetical protein
LEHRGEVVRKNCQHRQLAIDVAKNLKKLRQIKKLPQNSSKQPVTVSGSPLLSVGII